MEVLTIFYVSDLDKRTTEMATTGKEAEVHDLNVRNDNSGEKIKRKLVLKTEKNIWTDKQI